MQLQQAQARGCIVSCCLLLVLLLAAVGGARPGAAEISIQTTELPAWGEEQHAARKPAFSESESARDSGFDESRSEIRQAPGQPQQPAAAAARTHARTHASALSTCIRAQPAACCACVPRQRPPLDNRLSLRIGLAPQVPERPAASPWTNPASQRKPEGVRHAAIRRRPVGRCTVILTRASSIQWPPQAAGLPSSGGRDETARGLPSGHGGHGGQTLDIPGFYPGLVTTALGNLFNNRQWRPTSVINPAC